MMTGETSGKNEERNHPHNHLHTITSNHCHNRTTTTSNLYHHCLHDKHHRHHHHRHHRRRHRRHLRRRHHLHQFPSSRRRHSAALSLGGNSTRRSACVATQTEALAVACTARLGSRPRRAAGSMAPVCARGSSCLSTRIAAVVTTQNTCGRGMNVSTKRLHLSAHRKMPPANALVRCTTVGASTTRGR